MISHPTRSRVVTRSCSRIAAVLGGTAWLLAVGLAVSAPVSAAPITQTFVLAAGGQSSFGTYVIPPPVIDHFGADGLGVPAIGLAPAGVAGTMRELQSPTGPVADSTSVSSTGVSGFGAWSLAASCAASAQYGKLGAQAHATFSGATDANTVRGAEAFSLFRDTRLVATSAGVAPGTPGWLRFEFTIDGAMLRSGAGELQSSMVYRLDAGPIYTLMKARLSSFAGPSLVSGDGSGVGGFTVPPTAIAGSGAFTTFWLPMVYGTPFDLTAAMLAYALPSPPSGTLDVDFGSTALLSGIESMVAGQPVSEFLIVGDSGTVYGPDGVRSTSGAVPEPGSVGLLAIGLCVLRRRRGSR